MAKKPTEKVVNPVVVDEKLITAATGSQPAPQQKVAAAATAAEDKTLTSGVLKSRH